MFKLIKNKSNILLFSSKLRRELSSPINDMQFLIYEVFKFPERYSEIGYDKNEINQNIIDVIINQTAKFAQTELEPLNKIADIEGCKYIGPHEVKSPPGFKKAYEKYKETQSVGLSFPKKYGGQELPHSVSIFHSEILGTACQSWTSYTGLSKGAARTIIAHGSDQVKNLFVPKLVEGEWMGTMCLTEPHCGSDLNQVNCRADKREDGLYNINGTKIFISCAEHDITPNIVHLVLARIPGGPSGTHGISLFAVPKHFVEKDGKVDYQNYNGVNIGRIEDKMGYHGTPTCEINFENAVGYLIGREHKGMSQMFTFMNGARIGAATMGVNAAEKSYQNALQYAKTRRAFRAAKGAIDVNHAADPIIVHPDIRKMLLTQKAIAEGGRSMLYSCALLNDQLLKSMEIDDTATVDILESQLGFLTPILKGFLTERGIEAANLGIQIYGGHGYIRGNSQEQIYRDTRISAIWEGTTGIQALDLLRRKVFSNGIEDLRIINSHCLALQDFCKTMFKSTSNKDIQAHSEILFGKAGEWMELTRRISIETKKNPNALGIAAVDYLMYAGYITLAEHWLIMEHHADQNLTHKTGNHSTEFYEAKLQVAKFVYSTLLTRVEFHKLNALANVTTVMDLPTDHFSFDY